MRTRTPKIKANRIQIAGCYLYWWFMRRRAFVSDFDTQVKFHFSTMQFYTSLLLPLLLLVAWIEFKVFHLPPASQIVLHLVSVAIAIYIVDTTVLSHSKSLTPNFEAIGNRLKPDLLVYAYLATVLAVIMLSVFLFPHRTA
ncbi:hypothetical protein [Geothrix mesophila]|uniref:hypothetical protein n=1 Tax=Geothrix mesophila TaxID=2922723 RepID=UPI001FABE1F3|nr:hypothetical protein [Geothrix sp. SG198]